MVVVPISTAQEMLLKSKYKISPPFIHNAHQLCLKLSLTCPQKSRLNDKPVKHRCTVKRHRIFIAFFLYLQ